MVGERIGGEAEKVRRERAKRRGARLTCFAIFRWVMERVFWAITYVQERTYSAIVRERAHVHYSIPNSKTKLPTHR